MNSTADSLKEMRFKGSVKGKLYYKALVSKCVGKPDSRIYIETASLLGAASNVCIFVGDGGSSEFEGTKMTGMKAIQAFLLIVGTVL